MPVIRSGDVYLRNTGTMRGRGVFASREFAKGEQIEICPVVVLRIPSAQLPEALKHYVFDWGYLAEGTESRSVSALALGFGSMYNHDNPANMLYEADAAKELLVLTAARDVAKDEELTVNYNARGGGPEWHDDNWFERHGVERL